MAIHDHVNSSPSSARANGPARSQNILYLAFYVESVLVVVFLLMDILLLVTINNVAHSIHTTYNGISQSNEINNMLRTAERMNEAGLTNIATPNSHFTETIEQEKSNFNLDLQKYQTKSDQTQEAQINRPFQKFYKALLTTGKNTNGQPQPGAIAQYQSQVIPQYHKLISALNQQTSLITEKEGNALINNAITPIKHARTLLWLRVVIIPLIAIAFILYFGHFLKKRLRIPIMTLGETSQQLTMLSNSLYKSMNESSRSLAEITASSEEYRAMATSIAQSTLRIKEHAEQTVTEAEKATRISKESEQQATELAQLIIYFNKLIKQEQLADQKIKELSKKLSDIADETHVLAINASIEAAAAGVQGERFQVIANEVRYLAKQETTTSKEVQKLAQQIANNIDNLQQIHDAAKPATERNLQQAGETKEINISTLKQMAEIQKRLEEIALNSEQQEIAISNFVESLQALQKILNGQTSQRAKTLENITAINRTIEQLNCVVSVQSMEAATPAPISGSTNEPNHNQTRNDPS